MDLTVFAFAFLDKGFILDVFVTSLTIIPRPGKKEIKLKNLIKHARAHLPFLVLFPKDIYTNK